MADWLFFLNFAHCLIDVLNSFSNSFLFCFADKTEVSSKAPSKEERAICWKARDTYYDCLEANNEDAAKCKQLRAPMETLCPHVWVIIITFFIYLTLSSLNISLLSSSTTSRELLSRLVVNEDDLMWFKN